MTQQELALRIHQLIDAAKDTPSGLDIVEKCVAIAELLVRKNAAYGDSALKPVRIFSKVDSVEQIKVRIDDKLNRMQKGSMDGEDVVLDLMGYLVLLRVAEDRRLQSKKELLKKPPEVFGSHPLQVDVPAFMKP